MKVLHVIPSISAMHGGPSTAVETMTQALVRAGVDAEVAATDDDGAGRLDVPLGVPVMREGVKHRFFRKQTQFYKFSWPLTQWLGQNVERYDVLHLHALFSYATMPAAYYAARNKVPYVVRPLGTLNRVGMEQYHRTLKRVSFPLIEKRIIQGAAFLQYTSELEQAQARAMGVLQKSVVVPTGVALDDLVGERGRWRRANAPQLVGKTLFVFLGRLDPIKGLDALLPAFARVYKQDPNTALVLAGRGEKAYEAELRGQVARLGIENAVGFAGYIEGESKRALLRDADAFVLPSRSENQGVAAVEALAAGLPVIVTPEVGIAAAVVAGGAGLIASAEPDVLADAMRALAGDAAQRQEMGARAQALARETFSIEAMTDGLLRMYRAALGLADE